MNFGFEMVLRDINLIKENKKDNKKDNKSKDIKKENIKFIKKNKSIDNFIKFQWSWIM
jgi:hypothetical protein